ncbi:TonB-dependent receptor [Prevotella sp. HUN102]|uniref:TonB-dependent receptor n=1 Tax=Prevotella sp. HUN102 TaxID=1392486 RepID=UPI000490BF69|nr:TonB-dependent receptor [Prevotella sp. HUN102]
MNKAISAIILSMTALCAFIGLPINAANSYKTGNDLDTTVVMKNVTVTGSQKKATKMRSSVNTINIDRSYLQTNFSGSLMQTLRGIPGVKAMSIGSGQSKPAIRGLGFNRMAVAQDGIKHEGQQWGDDHGLEIDQFAVDRIEILKGPSALLYGSDAIAGVINLHSYFNPEKPFQGYVSLFSRTNNEALGASARLEGKTGNFFWGTNLTLIDYADYKVPTDSIQYYSYYIHLKDKCLRNTAGKERDGSIALGYRNDRFTNILKLSDSYSKSGFFANAHGIEVRLSDIDYDSRRRDIDLPYQSVNHFKVQNITNFALGKLDFTVNLAFQNNLRKELSEPVSHGYMPKPSDSLERKFNKSTYSANIDTKWNFGVAQFFNFGANIEYQHNRRSGWGFIVPDFEMFSSGAYAMYRYIISNNLRVNAGVRYDHIRSRIHSYNDWYKTPYNGTDSLYKQRSSDINRSFNSLTWSAGLSYSTGNWIFKSNIGKSFRVPVAKELGADGVNYNIFRYEKGNANLKPEESYQLDAGITWQNSVLSFEFEPYFNYFPNYIYMNPTPEYYEGLQLYHYTQARVFRWGFEAIATWKIRTDLEAELKGEYLYAEQLSGQKKGYSLPFSTPWSVDASVKYIIAQNKPGNEGYVSLNAHFVGAQKDIVPPEEPTPGYYTLNMTAGKQFTLREKVLKISLNAENLLNRKYYDHTSYYRLIDVPEPGRNIALMIGLDF